MSWEAAIYDPHAVSRGSPHMQGQRHHHRHHHHYPRDVVSAVYATAKWLVGWLAWWMAECQSHAGIVSKPSKPILELFQPVESPIILVSNDSCVDIHFQREPLQRGR